MNAEAKPPLNAVCRYVRKAATELQGLHLLPRKHTRFPFDSVGLSTLSKAFALTDACLVLIRADKPYEAYGLSRSVVECATNLRYLTADPLLQDDRARKFVKYAKVERSFWFYNAVEQFKGRKEEKEIRDYAQLEGIVADPKSARRHWSGQPGSFVWEVAIMDHPLDEATVSPAHRKAAYAVDYFGTSMYVHCSVRAIDDYFAKPGKPFQVLRASVPSKDINAINSVLFVVVRYLQESIEYTMFGMNTTCPDTIREAAERAKYVITGAGA